MQKYKKTQSALEFLMTYSWAFLIISMFVAIVFVVAFSRPPSYYLQSSCNLQPSFPCSGAQLAQYGSSGSLVYMVQFTNQLGVAVYFPANALNVTTTDVGVQGTANWIGNCTPQLAPVGASVLCTAYVGGSYVPAAASQTSAAFILNYKICPGGTTASCANSLYRSTGNSQQTFSKQATLYALHLITNPTTAKIAVNGVPYVNSTTLFLLPGNYVIYAQPPPHYAFASWIASNVVIAAQQQNTTATLSTNGTVTANFNIVTTIPTTSTTTTTTISTSISTSTSTIIYSYCSNTSLSLDTACSVSAPATNITCDAGFVPSSSYQSWTLDTSAGYSSLGHQSALTCSVSTGSTHSTEMVVAGIGLVNPPAYTFYGGSASNIYSYNHSYTVNNAGSFVVIHVACGRGGCFSITVPLGCTSLVWNNVSTFIIIERTPYTVNSTSYIAICPNSATGTFTVSDALYGSGSSSIGVYVYGG